MEQGIPDPYAPPGSRQPLAPQRQQLSALKITLLTVVVVLVVVGLVGLFVFQSLQNIGGRAPVAVSAPVVYSTQTATLSPSQPTVRGHFSVEGPRPSQGDLYFSLSAGAPIVVVTTPTAAGPTLDPATILAGAGIRVSATQGSYSVGCLAPCELRLPSYNCSSETCRA